MKRKTWIVSALMYALVFLVCFGVLHVFKKITNAGDGAEYTTEAAADTDIIIDGSGVDADRGNDPENGKNGRNAEAELSEDADGMETENDGGKDAHIRRETGYKGWKKTIEQVWPEIPKEEPYTPPKIIQATDLHYQSASSEDDGAAFNTFVERCDGKVVKYLPQLLDAFIDQVIKEKPAALVLSGDITMNGEKINHEELSERLHKVQDAGIPVLVIPGNHDINNPNAAVYFGDEKESTDSVTPEEFYDLYHMYGYDQAISRDSASLSYVYQLDERNRLLMLDSCQYEPKNLVEGRIKEETLAWMEEQLQKAKEDGMQILPIAHHNLLAQSRMYITQCAMENNGEVIDLLQKYKIPLFLSGHLHVQRIRKHKAEPGVADDAYGIQEIITDSISIPPCQYGILQWKEDGSMEYSTESVDVSSWAKRTGQENTDLLDFEGWSENYIQKLIADQIGGVVKNVGREVKRSMAVTYADVYIDYYAGRKIDAKGVRTSEGYTWWERNLPDSYLLKELNSMINDADRDNNYLLLPEDTILEERYTWKKATASEATPSQADRTGKAD